MDSGEVCAGSAAKQRPKGSSTKAKRKEEKQNHVVDGGAASGGESDSPAPTKGKGKGKTTRRRKKADLFMEEDIIGGFAFVSFKSSNDLEVSEAIFNFFIFDHVLLYSLSRFSKIVLKITI